MSTSTEKRRKYIRTYMQKYRKKNPDTIKAISKRYYEKNKAKLNEYSGKRQKAERETDPDGVRAKEREYYAADPKRRNEQAKRWYRDNAESRNAAAKRYTLTPEGLITKLMMMTKRRARGWKRNHSITRQWIADRLAVGTCEVTGIEFVIETRHAFRPSIDRTDCSKGYTPDNCKLVVFIYNLAKNTFGHEDVFKLAEGLIKHRLPL